MHLSKIIVKRLFLFLILLPTISMGYILNEKNLSTKLYSDQVVIQNKSDRLEIAKQLLDQMNELSQVIPSLSDISNKSLAEQWSSIVTNLNSSKLNVAEENEKNIESYFNNPDHYSFELHNNINFIRDSLQCVIKSKNINMEMTCWMDVSLGLIDIETWSDNLNGMIGTGSIENFDLIEGDKNFKAKNLPRFYHGEGKQILSKIIRPYLKDPSLFN